ncbi:MAG: tetratricopeptide repeat protein [Bacteroidales bacterium]|jgi:tetratricopeptide (TPR) repeat protein|nr:tetratricopeptide repeat protein [Bacteroidales bacterium]
MKTCKKCDLQYDDSKKFCKKCGEPLEAEVKIESKAEAKKQVFEEKLKTDPLNVKLLHEYAQFLYENKLLKEAASVALKIIAIDEKDNGAKALLFNAYLQTGDYPNAIETGEELYPSKNTDAAFLLLLANAYQQTGNSQRAIEIYDQLLKLESGNTEAAYHKALALLSQNKPEEAAPIFGQLHAGGKTDRITAIYAGMDKAINNEHEAAIEILTPVLSEKGIHLSDPDNNRGFLYLAYALCQTTANVKKIDQWTKMLDLAVMKKMHHEMDEIYLAKTFIAIFKLKINTLAKSAGRYEIEERLAEYIKWRNPYFTEHSNPVFAAAWYAAALKQESFGFYDDAIESMKRCVPLAPDKKEYSNKLNELRKVLADINNKKKKREVITWSVIIAIIAIAIGAYLGYQRFKDNKVWSEALEKNTSLSLQWYRVESPKGRYYELSKVLEDSLFWEESKTKNTIKAFNSYLKKFPAGDFRDEALTMKEKALWNNAKE